MNKKLVLLAGAAMAVVVMLGTAAVSPTISSAIVDWGQLSTNILTGKLNDSGDTATNLNINGSSVTNLTVYGVSVPNFSATVGFAWTCTNATTGAGEWRIKQAYDEILIPAGALTVPASGGAAPGTNTTLGISQDSFDYDSASPETNYYSFKLPDDMDLTVTPMAQLQFSQAATDENSNIVWGIQLGSAGDAEAYTFGTEVMVTNTVAGESNELSTCNFSAITIGGSPGKGHRCGIILRRVANSASDDVPGDAQLLGISIQYKRNATNSIVWVATQPGA